MRRGRKTLPDGRNAGSNEGGHIRMSWRLLDSPAFKALSPTATRVLLALWRRLDGKNNGQVPFGARDAQKYGIGKDAAAEALHELEALGFIVLVTESNLLGRRAREWRLTEEHTGELPRREKATHDARRLPAAEVAARRRELLAERRRRRDRADPGRVARLEAPPENASSVCVSGTDLSACQGQKPPETTQNGATCPAHADGRGPISPISRPAHADTLHVAMLRGREADLSSHPNHESDGLSTGPFHTADGGEPEAVDNRGPPPEPPPPPDPDEALGQPPRRRVELPPSKLPYTAEVVAASLARMIAPIGASDRVNVIPFNHGRRAAG
jgi:hypothetical protein